MRAILCAIAALASIGAAPGDTSIDDLGWMTGRWESVSGERWVEEQWTAPRGGTMFGVSRTGSGTELREFEFLRLQPGEDGVIAYHASAGGRAAVAFRLTRAEGSSATFENPRHDYPQLIRYERSGETIGATISASDGSNAMSWTFRRIP